MQITDISESKKFKKVISKDQQGSEQLRSHVGQHHCSNAWGGRGPRHSGQGLPSCGHPRAEEICVARAHAWPRLLLPSCVPIASQLRPQLRPSCVPRFLGLGHIS